MNFIVSTLMISVFFASPLLANATELTPYTITACAYGNGIHQMARRGVGAIQCNGKVIVDNVPCWQCKNCYEVVVTSGDPGVDGGIVGTYATKGYGYEISVYGTQIVVSDYYYTASKTLTGYRFYYQTRSI